MSIARRNLFQDKTRLVLSVLGIALAVMLILGVFAYPPKTVHSRVYEVIGVVVSWR